MTSLVEELQKDALNHSIKITDLLQKSLVVATKLNIKEFAIWVKQELEGYGDAEVPAYRKLHGRAEVYNPYRGYQPIEFQSVDDSESISIMHFNTPIGEIEHDLLSSQKSGNESFHFSYAAETQENIMNSLKHRMLPSLRISVSHFQGVIDAVRIIVLEWSLKLEEDGIVGDGMSFSPEEKSKAEGDVYNIKNYIRGDIQNSQIQIEATNNSQTQTIEFDTDKLSELIEAITATIEVIGLDEAGKQEVNSEIATLGVQIDSPNPNNTIIGESLSSLKRILEGAGGNLVANGLLNQMGVLFGV